MQNYKGCVPSTNKCWKKTFVRDSKKYGNKKNSIIPLKTNNFIRIFSYNVHYWTDITSNNITHKYILEKIKFLNPNILGLQEVLIPQDGNKDVSSSLGWTIKDVFKELLDEYKIETIGVSDTSCSKGTRFGNLLASKNNVSTVERIIFNTVGEKRGAIMGIVEGILFIVVHLDVWDNSGKTRRKQLVELFNFIDKRYDKNMEMIMVGDFNCLQRKDYEDNSNISGDFETIRVINEYGFEDIFNELNYTVWSGRRVDYIFVKNFYREIIGKYVYYDDLSDHFSLILDIDK